MYNISIFRIMDTLETTSLMQYNNKLINILTKENKIYLKNELTKSINK